MAIVTLSLMMIVHKRNMRPEEMLLLLLEMRWYRILMRGRLPGDQRRMSSGCPTGPTYMQRPRPREHRRAMGTLHSGRQHARPRFLPMAHPPRRRPSSTTRRFSFQEPTPLFTPQRAIRRPTAIERRSVHPQSLHQ